ncbi:MAG: helix-turn-helix domain-containing protein [Candidatus Sumerlaeia bacterium]
MALPRPQISPDQNMPLLRLFQGKGSERLRLQALNFQQVRGEREIFWDNEKRARHNNETYCMFQCSLGGKGYFRDPQGEWPLEPGRAFLAPVPSPTAYWLPLGENWEWIWIGFQGEWTFQMVEEFNATHGYRLDFQEGSRALRLAVSLVEDCMRRLERSPWRMSSRIYQLLTALQEEKERPQTKQAEPIEVALAYLEQNWMDSALNLERLACEAGISKYHFARQFREALGVPPGEYLRNLRLEQAYNMLAFTDKPVKQVAHECGFGSDIHFCAAFKKRYGVSPGSIRRG